MLSRRIAGNRKQVFVYHNGGCAYANGCDVSTAEGLDMLALVGLLLGGGGARMIPFGWKDVWVLNPELGLLWLKACAISPQPQKSVKLPY
jgi:hypothetical protein